MGALRVSAACARACRRLSKRQPPWPPNLPMCRTLLLAFPAPRWVRGLLPLLTAPSSGGL